MESDRPTQKRFSAHVRSIQLGCMARAKPALAEMSEYFDELHEHDRPDKLADTAEALESPCQDCRDAIQMAEDGDFGFEFSDSAIKVCNAKDKRRSTE